MAWDVYNVEANKNQALVRVNNLQEKKIYEINGDSRDLISSYLLTFKPFANMKGGSKNMLSHIAYEGLRKADAKIFSGGSMEMDLTQTSYSTVPSIDIELGDKVSDHSESGLRKLAEGLVAGVNIYFGK